MEEHKSVNEILADQKKAGEEQKAGEVCENPYARPPAGWVNDRAEALRMSEDLPESAHRRYELEKLVMGFGLYCRTHDMSMVYVYGRGNDGINMDYYHYYDFGERRLRGFRMPEGATDEQLPVALLARAELRELGFEKVLDQKLVGAALAHLEILAGVKQKEASKFIELRSSLLKNCVPKGVVTRGAPEYVGKFPERVDIPVQPSSDPESVGWDIKRHADGTFTGTKRGKAGQEKREAKEIGLEKHISNLTAQEVVRPEHKPDFPHRSSSLYVTLDMAKAAKEKGFESLWISAEMLPSIGLHTFLAQVKGIAKMAGLHLTISSAAMEEKNAGNKRSAFRMKMFPVMGCETCRSTGMIEVTVPFGFGIPVNGTGDCPKCEGLYQMAKKPAAALPLEVTAQDSLSAITRKVAENISEQLVKMMSPSGASGRSFELPEAEKEKVRKATSDLEHLAQEIKESVPEDPELLLCDSEAAGRLAISLGQLHSFVSRGDIRGFLSKGKMMFRLGDMETFKEELVKSAADALRRYGPSWYRGEKVVAIGDETRPATAEDLADVQAQLAQVSTDPNFVLNSGLNWPTPAAEDTKKTIDKMTDEELKAALVANEVMAMQFRDEQSDLLKKAMRPENSTKAGLRLDEDDGIGVKDDKVVLSTMTTAGFGDLHYDPEIEAMRTMKMRPQEKKKIAEDERSGDF